MSRVGISCLRRSSLSPSLLFPPPQLLLHELWRLAFPGRELPGMRGPHWKEMGWQGALSGPPHLRGCRQFPTQSSGVGCRAQTQRLTGVHVESEPLCLWQRPGRQLTLMSSTATQKAPASLLETSSTQTSAKHSIFLYRKLASPTSPLRFPHRTGDDPITDLRTAGHMSMRQLVALGAEACGSPGSPTAAGSARRSCRTRLLFPVLDRSSALRCGVGRQSAATRTMAVVHHQMAA